MSMIHSKVRSYAVGSLAVALGVQSSVSAAIVYEGFGSNVADGATIAPNATLATTGSTGFAAASNWTVTNSGGTPNGAYLATGLSFGTGATTLSTTGGAVRLQFSDGNTGSNVRISRPIANNGIVSGSTLFGSYLIRPSYNAGTNTQSVANLYVNSTATDGTSAAIRVDADGFQVPTGGRILASGYNSGDGSGMLVGTTYMMLMQVSNVESSSNQTLTAWLLTSAQFDNFRSGPFDAATLNAAAAGTASTQVLSTLTSTLSPGNAAVTTDSLSAHFGFFQGNTGTGLSVTYDELRFGTTSLTDVTPVPEPAAIGLAGAALLVMGRRRRTA